MIICFFCGAGLTPAAESPQTNLQVLRQLYDDIIKSAFENISFNDSDSILIRTHTDEAYKWLIEERLVERLHSLQAKNIFTDRAGDSDAPFTVIDVNPVEQAINYKKLKAKKLQRNVDVEIFISVKGANKKLLLSRVLKQSRSDTVNVNDKKRIENPQQSFTQGSQRQSFIRKISEPVIVSLITGFIIYLFYSYRSQ